MTRWLNLSFAQVERAPSAVELFMHGAHMATGRLEIGDEMDSERSTNIDLTFNYENNDFRRGYPVQK